LRKTRIIGNTGKVKWTESSNNVAVQAEMRVSSGRSQMTELWRKKKKNSHVAKKGGVKRNNLQRTTNNPQVK